MAEHCHVTKLLCCNSRRFLAIVQAMLSSYVLIPVRSIPLLLFRLVGATYSKSKPSNPTKCIAWSEIHEYSAWRSMIHVDWTWHMLFYDLNYHSGSTFHCQSNYDTKKPFDSAVQLAFHSRKTSFNFFKQTMTFIRNFLHKKSSATKLP